MGRDDQGRGRRAESNRDRVRHVPEAQTVSLRRREPGASGSVARLPAHACCSVRANGIKHTHTHVEYERLYIVNDDETRENHSVMSESSWMPIEYFGDKTRMASHGDI